jgi:septum formation protein
MLRDLTEKYQITLASNSPRRKELLNEIIPIFKVESKEVEEIYPNNLQGGEIATYLSQLKSKPFQPNEKELIITADTIVILGSLILGKPKSLEEAIHMLTLLSGKKHEIITGVTIRTKDKELSFYDSTKVEFYELKPEEIEYYVKNYKPFDKAGAYGIQEWIGAIGIKKMEGDFYNVMGLPVHRVYRELNQFI